MNSEQQLAEIIEQALVDPFREVLEQQGPDAVSEGKRTEVSPGQTVSGTIDEAGRESTGVSEFSTEIFRHPIELVLRPHATVAQIILTRIYQARTRPETTTVIERYGSDLVEKLEEIRRFYRVYVETSAEDHLEKEASRLVKRFFQENPTENQKDFIRLKRFYEKIRSFQDRVEMHWNDVEKLIDTFSIIPETRPLVKDLPEKHLPEINSLLRRTTLFLMRLKDYAKIEDQSVDPVTGNLTARLVYNQKIHYTVKAALASEELMGIEIPAASPPEIKSEKVEAEERGEESSIAHNIVLQSRSRRFHQSNFYSIPIIGSRDWNRSFHYNLEIGMIDFQEESNLFADAFHLILNREDMERAVQIIPLASSRGTGAKRRTEYADQIIQLLDETANRLIEEDFPGIAKKEIFLYHIGPNTFYSILIQSLRLLHIGDIFYVNKENQIIRILPELILKKVLIDWWVERFSELDIEEVDSYLTYSRNLELMRTEYINLYETAREIRRKEEPGASYRTFDRWLRKNKLRIFGIRRYEVFRRFFPDLLFQMDGE